MTTKEKKKKNKKKKKKKKKKKQKKKKIRPSTSRENYPAHDALSRTKLAGCSCERREATETYTAEHAGNTKGVPTIDASVPHMAPMLSAQWIPDSIAQEKAWPT